MFEQEKRKWVKPLLIVAATLGGLYLLFWVVYFGTARSETFCTACHQIKPYVSSWRRSPHVGVDCMHCHESRGFLGKTDSALRGLNYVYIQLTGEYTIIPDGKIYKTNCIDCHLGGFRGYKKASRLDKTHFTYIKENRSCLECHRETGHKVNLFGMERFR